MKGSSTLVASMVAASTMALSSSSSSSTNGQSFSCGGNGQQISKTASSDKKFEPRFDGLRFIETLVTAHR